MLEAIGVTPDEERFYLAVLQDQGASVSAICRTLGISIQRGTVLAATLEDKGLVSRASGRLQRVVAAPPEAALEPLLMRSQEDLAQAGRAIARLAKEHTAHAGQRSAHELIEIVVGTEAMTRRHEQLQRSAREEIRAFVRPPRTATPAGTNRTEIRLLRSGVRFRAVYDREALRVPGSVEEISLYQAEGEQARALETLPMKMVIADRSQAIVPLSTGETPVEPGAILVYPSALLDALIALFDALWAAGIPLTPPAPPDGQPQSTPAGVAVRNRSPLTDEDTRILGLLLAGLTDEAVARQLGLSVRTVQRRVQRLMGAANVTTRLQLGWYAQQHGWL